MFNEGVVVPLMLSRRQVMTLSWFMISSYSTLRLLGVGKHNHILRVNIDFPDGHNAEEYVASRNSWIQAERLQELREKFISRGWMSSFYIHDIDDNHHQTCYFFKSADHLRAWEEASQSLYNLDLPRRQGYRIKKLKYDIIRSSFGGFSNQKV
jgi:hypothetical protein